MYASNENFQNQNLYTHTGDRNTNKEVVIVTGRSSMIGSSLILKQLTSILSASTSVLFFGVADYGRITIETQMGLPEI